MMEKLIFEFSDYREYLLHKLGAKGRRTGGRQELAKHLRVHTTLISLILQGKSELSLEHAEEANDFFRHTDSEGEYFSLLVQKSRAGTAKLKKRLDHKLNLLLEARDEVRHRVKSDHTLPEQHQRTYYSSVLYSLHHMGALLEGDPSKLAKAFSCTIEKSKEILEFLLSADLLRKEANHYALGATNLHLEVGSPLIRQYHTNFRLQALQRLESATKEDFHFSSAITLSRADAKKIRQNILDFVEQQADVVRPSPSEELYVLNLDYFHYQTREQGK